MREMLWEISQRPIYDTGLRFLEQIPPIVQYPWADPNCG